MKKKVLMSIVLLAFVTAGAVFAQAPTLDKLNLTLTDQNKTYVVYAANNNISGEVVIPDTYNNLPVTTIANAAFSYCTKITSVTLGKNVNQINGWAFRPTSGDYALTSVTFQSSGISFTGVNHFPGDLVAKYKAGGPGTYTRQAGGTVWTKQAAASVPKTSLDGNWRSAEGNIITISGSTAVWNYVGNFSHPLWQDGKDKGYIKEGVQFYRNLRSTGNLTWSGQQFALQSNTRTPNVANGTGWGDITITMSPDGNTFVSSAGGTWIRAGIQ